MRVTTLRHALRLPVAEAARLAAIWIVLGGAELSLRLWPLQTLLEKLDRHAASRRTNASAATLLPMLAAQLELADRHQLCPPSCLRKAIALIWLLHRRGIAAQIRIGVAHEHARMRAHAWVELKDEPRLSVFHDEHYLPLNLPSRVPYHASALP